MKKKIVLLGLMLQASSSMFAQTANSRSDINSMLFMSDLEFAVCANIEDDA